MLAILLCSGLGAQSWIRKNNSPLTASGTGSFSFTIGNYGYVNRGHGIAATGDTSEMWKYDASADSWTLLPAPPVLLSKAGSFAIGNYGYAGMGYSSGILSDSFFRYDPGLNKWSVVAKFPTRQFADGGSFVTNGFGYIVGGADSAAASLTNSSYRYDPVANNWTSVANLPAQREALSGFTINDTAYALMGLKPGDSISNAVFRYLPSVDSWVKLSDFPGKSYGGRHCNFVLNNEVYFCLDSAQCWKYTPTADQWQRLPNTPFGLVVATFVIHGVAYLIPEFSANVWEFCPPVQILQTNSLSICSGNKIALSASGGNLYSWSPATGLSSTSISNPIASPADSITYIINVADSNGCHFKDSVRVNIKPFPVVQAIANRSDICFGDTTQIKATAGMGYSWTPVSGLTNPSIANPIASPTDTTRYILTATNLFGCTIQDTVTINVRPLPAIHAKAQPGTICPGDASKLSCNIRGLSYSWSPGKSLDDSVLIRTSANPLSSTTYTITATDTLGCSNKTTISLNVISAPPIIASANPSTICKGDTSLLNASGSVYYSWSPDTTLTGSVTSASNLKAFPWTSFTYTVTGTDSSGGCLNTAFVSITVSAFPASPSISENLNTLSSSASSGNQWYLNGNIIPGATNQSDTPLANGSYMVCTTNASGCSSCSKTILFDALAVTEINLFNTITLYPNPAFSEFSIDYSNSKETELTIDICNLMGEKMKTVYCGKLKSGKHRTKIQTEGLAKGVYFVILNNGNSGMICQRLIISE